MPTSFTLVCGARNGPDTLNGTAIAVLPSVVRDRRISARVSSVRVTVPSPSMFSSPDPRVSGRSVPTPWANSIRSTRHRSTLAPPPDFAGLKLCNTLAADPPIRLMSIVPPATANSSVPSNDDAMACSDSPAPSRSATTSKLPVA